MAKCLFLKLKGANEEGHGREVSWNPPTMEPPKAASLSVQQVLFLVMAEVEVSGKVPDSGAQRLVPEELLSCGWEVFAKPRH